MLLGCWNKACPNVFNLECRPSDQALYCDSCRDVATFVNIGYFICNRCRKKSQVLLTNVNRIFDIRCALCHTLYVGTGNFRIYSLEMVVEDDGSSFGLQYCGRSRFESLESEVLKGKKMIDSILARGKWKMLFGKKVQTEKNIMFINRLEPMYYPGKKLPIDYLQSYHAICNYRLYEGHENAKFLGVLSQFASSSAFDIAAKPGLNEIWFSDGRTKGEFETLPQLRKYQSIFRAV